MRVACQRNQIMENELRAVQTRDTLLQTKISLGHHEAENSKGEMNNLELEYKMELQERDQMIKIRDEKIMQMQGEFENLYNYDHEGVGDDDEEWEEDDEHDYGA